MPTIISVVGKSESGKTTLLELLVAELKRRGYKIAVIKHAGGEGFELDKKGSDTWRLTEAGSEVVAISSPSKIAILKPVERDLSPAELSRFIGWDCDLILTEGFKKSGTPKIEVHRRDQGKGLLSPADTLLAIITDEKLDVAVPQFSKENAKGLADLIERKLKAEPEEDAELYVNNSVVPVSPVTKGILAKVVLSVVSGVKGVGKIKSLHFILRRRA